MARRDMPYLPLYVQDFLTDEKLIECSAESTGVYIRLLCILHKSQDYGKILLKQKDKQNGKQIFNFALKLSKQMPWDLDTIVRGLTELCAEGVISIEGDALFQKRMVKDGELSETRSKAGQKGGKHSRGKQPPRDDAGDFAKAKSKANTKAKPQANSENENENEYEYETEIVSGKEKNGKSKVDAGKAPPPFSGALQETFEAWVAYKRERRESYKPRGLQTLVGTIREYVAQFGEEAVIEGIKSSMASNYAGIVFDRIGRGREAGGGKKAPPQSTTFADVYEGMQG